MFEGISMEDKYYICKHSTSCTYAGNKKCPFGLPISKNALRKLYGGIFNSRLMVLCNHPEIRAGVSLIEVHTEGNYHSIW